jgi:Predicted metal-binding, possibly nucleic acid-binding protein
MSSFDTAYVCKYNNKVMLEKLPSQINALHLAQCGQSLTGRIALSLMPRLTQLLNSSCGYAKVQATFGVDGQSVRYVQGQAEAQLQMTCQRCLEPMVLAVTAKISLGFATSEEAAQRLPAVYEPYIVTSESVSLATLIEDELLLSLPIIAVHPDPEACGPLAHMAARAPEKQQVHDNNNPFAVLAKFRRHD